MITKATAIIFAAFLLLPACAVELVEPTGPSAHPLEGVWLSQATFAKATGNLRTILEIWMVPKTNAYEFRLLTLAHRELVITGKTAFYTEITGRILTSPREVLLRREKLRVASAVNKSKTAGPIWLVSDYQPEMLDREIIRSENMAVLALSEDGNTLTGSDHTFVRAAPLRADGRSAVPVGVVIRTAEDGRRAQALQRTSSPMRSGTALDVLHRGALAGRIKLSAAVEREAAGELTEGRAEPGDLLVIPGKSDLTPTQLPSKQDTIEKLKRGENVPRESLIKLLEK